MISLHKSVSKEYAFRLRSKFKALHIVPVSSGCAPRDETSAPRWADRCERRPQEPDQSRPGTEIHPAGRHQCRGDDRPRSCRRGPEGGGTDHLDLIQADGRLRSREEPASKGSSNDLHACTDPQHRPCPLSQPAISIQMVQAFLILQGCAAKEDLIAALQGRSIQEGVVAGPAGCAGPLQSSLDRMHELISGEGACLAAVIHQQDFGSAIHLSTSLTASIMYCPR